MGAVASLFAAAAIGFSQHGGQLALKAPGYRLVLSAANGRILALDDAQGRQLLGGSYGCLWWLNADHHATSVGGCSFRPTHRWNARSSTLTLTYGRVAVVTLRAHPSSFDLRLALRPASVVRDEVRFPAGLAGDTRTVQAGYAPDVLPGVKLLPSFFSRVGNPIQIYPSRWSFADWLALDVGGGHVAVYTVNRGPIAPVSSGFLHLGGGAPCSGRVFCLYHQFETWVKPGAAWTSPVVRVRVGETPEQAILDYRHDNGIDAYPSLADKLGPRLGVLARAPLLKLDEQKLQVPFATLGAALAQLPSPALVHPVGYEPGGADTSDPDFLPPDPALGTTADLAAAIAAAHARGDLFMPYDNFSWWDPASPTMRATSPATVAVLDQHGAPVLIDYGTHSGVIVSPFAQLVRQRSQQELDEWRSLGADCVFLDQLGARPWLRDFNPAEPTPLAYDDGWLALLAANRDRCLMVEDGWDRLARDAVGFHGGLLMMQRELAYVDHYFGAGNWEPYPLATWLLHDKVLMYQHDLFPLTMAGDGEVVAWNLAFGLVGSVEWHGDDASDPWIALAARVQQDFGPLYAGVPLRAFAELAPGVTRSVFGDLTVEANLSAATYDGIAGDGVRARTADGSMSLQTYPGNHWLLVERTGGVTTVRQPVGGTTTVTVPGPASQVVGPSGPVPFTRDGGNVTFTYAAGAAAYRVQP